MLLLASLAAGPLHAQTLDSVLTPTPVATGFEAAVRLAIAPGGTVYVVDAGRDALVRVPGGGRPPELLGGPGLQAGAFDGPADIDPTNGLVLYVADAGNGRVQLFSREFLPLRSVVVPAETDALRPRPGEPLQQRRAGIVEGGTGRPIAVATSPTNELFVLDDVQRAVWHFDAARRPIALIGGFDAGEGALADPVDLAVDQTALYVLDAAMASILVYDQSGRLLRVIGRARDWAPSRVVCAADVLLVVEPRRVIVLTRQGQVLRTLLPTLDEAIVDVAWADGTLFWLTPTGLYRSPQRL